MLVTLDRKLSQKLAGWPETGMGYQRIDLILSDGRRVHDVLAFNGEEVELPERILAGVTIVDVAPALPSPPGRS